MAIIVKPNTFSAGNTILAAEHNSNFDTIYSEFNGSITNANIDASANIADTKLAQITSAAKVHGTSLTGLASIPAGAGDIPAANLDNVVLAGDVTGDYDVNTVEKLRGTNMTATAPSTGQVIYYDGTNWIPSIALDPEDRYRYYDDFEQTSDQSSSGALYAVNSRYSYAAAGQNVDGNQAVGGVWTVEADGTVNPQLFLTDGSGVAVTDFTHPFKASKNPTLKVRFQMTGSTAAPRNVWLGLTPDANAPDASEPTDGIYLYLQDSGFVTKCKDSGSSTSSLGSADNSWHTVTLTITSSTVDSTYDGTAKTQITSNIPSGDLGFFINAQETTNGEGVLIDYILIEQDR